MDCSEFEQTYLAIRNGLHSDRSNWSDLSKTCIGQQRATQSSESSGD